MGGGTSKSNSPQQVSNAPRAPALLRRLPSPKVLPLLRSVSSPKKGLSPEAAASPSQRTSSSSTQQAPREPREDEWGAEEVPEDLRWVPVFFMDILKELVKHREEFGGMKHFQGYVYPSIDHKVKKEDFKESYSDFEYIFLTILGFAKLHMEGTEIVRLNNGASFQHNPAVQMLEQNCGMTMHGDRPGANAMVRTAPASMVQAFEVAKTRREGLVEFFQEAFERTADPCLEGRTGRLLAYLEARGGAIAQGLVIEGAPPWEDVTLKPLKADAAPRDIVGEHLRIFMNECTWAWSKERGCDYEAAKERRSQAEISADFSRLFNAEEFEAFMTKRGVVAEPGRQWEIMTGPDSWIPYQEAENTLIEEARSRRLESVTLRVGPKGWSYEIDLVKSVQRNARTGTERTLRFIDGFKRPGRVTAAELKEAVEYFVELATLPPRPTRVSM